MPLTSASFRERYLAEIHMAYAARRTADDCSVLRYDPHRVNDARDVAQKRQNDVYPKMLG